MFDIGFLELLIIGIVALIVVGPKDLPGMFRTVGRFMGKARGMAREFQRSMEEAADESGINEAAKGLRDIDNLNLNSATKSAKTYAKDFVTGKDDPAPSDDAKVTAPAKPAASGAKTGAAAKPAAPKSTTSKTTTAKPKASKPTPKKVQSPKPAAKSPKKPAPKAAKKPSPKAVTGGADS